MVYAFVDKDYGMAALSALECITMGASGVLTLAAKGSKLSKGASLVRGVSNFVSNTVNFTQNLSTGVSTVQNMYEKYVVQGQSMDISTVGEVGTLLLSGLGCFFSARGAGAASEEISDVVKQSRAYGMMKDVAGTATCKVKSTVMGGVHCFVAGTLVHTEEGLVAIEDIRRGNYVLAYDEETGETGYKKVVHIFRNFTWELAHVEVEGTEEIICTPGHRFYVEGEWIPVEDLTSGDLLTLADGSTAEILSITIEELETPEVIYNFEVEDWHNYYVADSGVLVHNNKCTGGVVSSGKGAASDKISTPVPVPEKIKAKNGLYYKSNEKHTPGQMGSKPDAGIEPRNSLELFENSVASTKTSNARFAYDEETSTLHRFFFDGIDTWHWSGSTNQGTNSLTSSQVPIDIKRLFDLPKKGW